MERLKIFGAVAFVFALGFILGVLVSTRSTVRAAGKMASDIYPGRRKSSTKPVSDRDRSTVTASDVQTLQSRRIAIPVAGVRLENIKDTFNDARGGRKHEATDIMAPTGTPVVAADDGVIKKFFTSRAGGLTIYEFDTTGQYCFYYAHLHGYAAGLKEGDSVRRGDIIGYVDSTGDATPDAPHLHFAIFKLGPERKWWEGTPINPYPILMTLPGAR